MNPTLSFSDFINRQSLSNQELFPENLINLLGPSLEHWINSLLNDLGLNANPKILGKVHPNAVVEGRVYIGKDAVVGPGAYIQGPAFIGAGSEVRHCAYIRGTSYIGRNCVVGHTTEVKGACFLDGAKAGHFAYVGDSILGRDTNLGAGTKIANLKIRGNEVSFKDPQSGQLIKSGLRKFGAILGDGGQTGCNAVLSPGTLLLPGTAVLPAKHFHGTLKSGWA